MIWESFKAIQRVS